MRTKATRVAALLTLALACYAPMDAQESSARGLVFSGSLSTRAGLIGLDPFDRAGDYFPDEAVFPDREVEYSGTSVLDLGVVNSNRRLVKFEGAVRVGFAWGPEGEALALIPGALVLGDMIAFPELRKLYLSVYTDALDLTVGRQIVNYGRGAAFSPIDVFSKIDYSDAALGRLGSDAVRVVVPVGDLSVVEAVASLAEGMDAFTAGLRGATVLEFLGDMDASLLALYRAEREEFLLGIDFKGDAGIGFFGESLVHVPLEDPAWFEGSAGIDYSIENTVFLRLEYYFNGSGIEGDANDMQAELLDELSEGVAFARMHYLFFSGSWDAEGGGGMTLSALFNPVDTSVAARIDGRLSLSQAALLSAYVTLGVGSLNGLLTVADAVAAGLSVGIAF